MMHRYASRAGWYEAGRPDYPAAAIDRLVDPGGVPPPAAVVELGAGTGILTSSLLDRGYDVRAVEPDRDMRARAETRLGARSGYVSCAGTAEETGLPDGCADAIAVGQALHWFDLARARRELARILRPGGAVLLLWNELELTGELGEALQQVLGGVPAYRDASAAQPCPRELARAVVAPGYVLDLERIPHRQQLGRSGLRSRFLSTSWAPAHDDPSAVGFVRALDTVFDAHQRGGTITLAYQTTTVIARPGRGGEGIDHARA